MTKHSGSIILLRGLPGSGKSTLAEILSESGKYPVYSIDDYFTDDNGIYSFNHLNNHLAYDVCQKRVLKEIKAGTEKILVDNTFTMKWEMDPYFKMAEENHYRIFVITVENYHGHENIHGIPGEQMQKMNEKFKVKLLP